MASYLDVFFFSSRRRHTRSLRDWSSDVCSSDLDDAASLRTRAGDGRPHRRPLRPGTGRHGRRRDGGRCGTRSEEHTSELQSRRDLVCRLLLEKKKKKKKEKNKWYNNQTLSSDTR